MHHMLRYHVERISFPLEPKGLTRITSVTYILHKGDCVHATREGHDTTVFYVSTPLLSCVRVCHPLRPNIQMAHELHALKSWASDYGLVARAASHGDALPRPKPFRTPGQNGQTVPTQRALLQWLKACLATPIASLLEPETTWMFMASGFG